MENKKCLKPPTRIKHGWNSLFFIGKASFNGHCHWGLPMARFDYWGMLVGHC